MQISHESSSKRCVMGMYLYKGTYGKWKWGKHEKGEIIIKCIVYGNQTFGVAALAEELELM